VRDSVVTRDREGNLLFKEHFISAAVCWQNHIQIVSKQFGDPPSHWYDIAGSVLKWRANCHPCKTILRGAPDLEKLIVKCTRKQNCCGKNVHYSFLGLIVNHYLQFGIQNIIPVIKLSV
jgi:hypothetical protein